VPGLQVSLTALTVSDAQCANRAARLSWSSTPMTGWLETLSQPSVPSSPFPDPLSESGSDERFFQARRPERVNMVLRRPPPAEQMAVPAPSPQRGLAWLNRTMNKLSPNAQAYA
jgi:hypothetical protein